MNQATGSPALGIAFVVVVALALIVGAIVWSRRR